VNERLPTWTKRHPILWAIVAALAMGATGALLFGSLTLAAAVAVPFGFVNWLLWRPAGPAHRWRTALVERFPPKH
jgi:hypothetical protein